MATRTKEQILEQAVYAVACVFQHYGPGFSEEGLNEVRELLRPLDLCTDATFRVDRAEGEKYIDFDQRIVWPEGWWKFSIKGGRVDPDYEDENNGDGPDEAQRLARIAHYQRRNELAAEIRKDIDDIGCIYPSIGKAMYDEPRDRLSQKISHRILGDWPGDKR